MNEFFTEFHFMRPYFLGLLIIPIIFYLKYFKGGKNQSAWEKVCDKKLLQYLLVKGSAKTRKTISYLLLISFIFSVLALSAPAWQKKEVPNIEPENPVMILLNLSSEMMKKDLPPDRLARAKHKITDMLKMINSAQVGLVVYSEEPFLISPLTSDFKVIENLLPAISPDIMPINGNRLDRAIVYAVDKFHNAGFLQGNIVVFAPDAGAKFDDILNRIKENELDYYTVNVVVTGKEGSEKLKTLAQRSGGFYSLLTADNQDIKHIAETINHSVQNELKLSENLRLTYEDFGYYLCFVPLLGCLFLFRKGILVIVFLLGVSTHTAEARFLLNADQSGYKRFNEENYEAAAQTFKSSKWKAASLYKLGKYDEAYKEYAAYKDVTSLYNQGNALAKGGKIEEAIKKYEEVLKISPKHEDAAFNLEYLKKQQENQQNKNRQSQDKQNEQDQSSQSEDEKKEQQDSDKTRENQVEGASEEEDNKPPEDQNKPQDNDEKDQKQSQPQQAQSPEEKSQKENSDPVGVAKEEGDKNDDFSEEAQANEMRYREIPEDYGGLLREFIKKEYLQKRYEE